MKGVPLSSDTHARLAVLFPGADRTEAERLLVEQCGRNLPFPENATSVSLERIRFAALKESGGDLVALRSAIELAKLDWRDLLVSANFANSIHAHEYWFPDEGGGE